MFADTKALSAFAVDDLAQARTFYGETLGIRVSGQHGLLTLNLAGGHGVRVYPKPDHTPASYTILMFRVDDIEAAVGELTRRGVRFERYDGIDQDEQGITQGGGPFIAAWFKDPAGTWRNSAVKALERQLAVLAQAPVTAQAPAEGQ